MGIIVALDFGKKRTGIAITDPLQLIASGLTTVDTKDLISFLKDYCSKATVETFVVGLPKQMNNQPSESEQFIQPFIKTLKNTFPKTSIEREDERFTSKMAFQSMIDSGIKKRNAKIKL